MFKNVLPAITALFASAKLCRKPVTFSWRLVCRKKRPFLLLPEKSGSSSDGFQLYSAHRPLAKLWRSLVPLILATPLAKIFGQVVIEADTESEFMQFLAAQSGLPAAQLPSPAIKFGGVVGKTKRVVLLLRDAGGHPIRVVKVGLDPAGRAATEREASLLSNLPKEVIGCTGITGRFISDTMSAFATAYFSGESLDTDLGVEKLFHDWLNDAPPEPIRNLAIWRELQSVAKGAGLPQWPILRDALAEQSFRTTIYHGDFAPWNVRMTNLETIRAFDWERGHLKGIPAWDWFHFIVQTSILVKRYSPERVAAELEQLVHSPRFQKYASDAGISEIVEPLLLAYLLEQKLIVRPLEGIEQIDRLFRLLWAKWQLEENTGKPAIATAADLRIPAREQIKFAVAKLANLFWEPSLSPVIKTPLSVDLPRYWLALLVSFVWIGCVSALQFSTDPHLTFAPFYMAPCVLLALKADRRLGLILACIAGVAGPLMQHLKQPMMIPLDITLWNMAMRVLVFILMVVLLDNVRQQSPSGRSPHTVPEQNANQAISGNWAVVLITSIYFAMIVALDVLTNPYYIFLPLYLLPCVIFTLTLNWRWGTLAAVIASVVGPLTQRFEDPGYQLLGVEFWNTLMRLMIFQTVVLLLDRVRRRNILFSSMKSV
ncbi:MAG: hypothetical protein P4L50_20350 [Anaerolineaceae bacterium]|nr:hypothetical protein [Anaerolineaceae bacterium]